MKFGSEVFSLWLIGSVALGRWLWCEDAAEAPSPIASVKDEGPAIPFKSTVPRDITLLLDYRSWVSPLLCSIRMRTRHVASAWGWVATCHEDRRQNLLRAGGPGPCPVFLRHPLPLGDDSVGG